MKQIPAVAVVVAYCPLVAFAEPKEAVASFGDPVLVGGSCYQNFQTVAAPHFAVAD